MNAQEITIICTAVTNIVLGLGAMWFAYKAKVNAKAALDVGQHNASVGASNAEQIAVIHKATNSLVEKLVVAEKAESFAAGAKSETDKAQQKKL